MSSLYPHDVRRIATGTGSAGGFAGFFFPSLRARGLGEEKPVPPYSAIVYKEGDEVRAEDRRGRKIASGEAEVDDASVIQSALDQKGVVIIGKNIDDVFNLSSTIYIDGNVRGIINGQLKFTNVVDCIIFKQNASNIEVTGSGVIETDDTVTGAIFGDEGSVSKVWIHRLYLKPYKWGFYLNSAEYLIEQNIIEHIATGLSEGASIKGRRMTGSIIKGNICINHPPSGGIMDTAPAQYETEKNIIEGNILIADSSQLCFAIDLTGSQYKVVKNNLAIYGHIGWEPANNAKHITLEGNIVIDPKDHAIHIPNGQHITVKNNHVIFTTVSDSCKGIALGNSPDHYIIESNIVIGAFTGIYCEGGKNIKIKDNNIEKCYAVGILCDADYSEIIGNSVKNCNQGGMPSLKDREGIIVAHSRGVIYALVKNNQAYDDQDTKTQNYGLQLGSGGGANVPKYVVVKDNILTPNLSGSIYIDNLGAGCVIKNNIGYTTENSGVAVFSGDGTTTQFSIAHGLVSEPSKVQVTPMTEDAAGDFYVTKDATNIYVNYLSAPPSGSNNVKLSWYAEV